ncbi:hypothetical protein MKK70_30090 [Methylobacterium sp. E-041]|jgi:hypothetical protein|uniref:hypothetical protein n=1 Tax=unclassified Methylobacterium TaxID=2615210 RepID=UPI0011CB8DA5|nr:MULTISPECIES: hypothetical protein [unclassified Methylobacterium]MCJ2008495.1 hypothetical protein [Methylobacterium sp. J-092]MCJ2042307.1 hypothetical protein [Methylobacterium sp. J-059]MCJ2075916.1 hypothetical protein [Methylobacterium sp. E-016]MCJ2109540.1 hypothetical protein [Methylobacterium sp. E-041]MCJ2113706.1 hypothetical protein [Methylobacterium sp. E-025]
MKNVTVTMDEAVLRRARIAAATEGKSLSKFISETVERRIGHPTTQTEALERFLAGPPLHVLDENGKAPPRNERYRDE